MTSIRVEHADGSEDALTYVRDSILREFGKIDQGRIVTTRTDANSVTLVEDEDEVYLEEDGSDVFGGVLKDIKRGGGSVELVVDSFERYAREAEPTPGGDRLENVSDDTVINQAISDTPELTAGTVTQIETGLTFVFSHASQAKKIRTVEEATTGEVQYNADKTVDYLTRLGSDESASITISPGNQNLDGEIEVVENGGEKNLTHLRMLGAGEGKHQLVANIVPDADGGTYENKVTYTSAWEAGDREVWDSYINTEATDQATLETQGLTLIEELNSKYVELKATLKGVDVELGDEVQVSKPKDNIDRTLRIVEWVRINDNDGLRYEVVLSSRQKSREQDGSKDRKDIQRYNKGFEGTPVTLTAGGGRQPVDSSNPYEFSFYYPSEVNYEHRVKLQVKGLPYRAYSQGAADGGGTTQTSTSGGTNSDTTESGGGSSPTSEDGGVDFVADTTEDGGSDTIFETSDANNPHGAVAAVGTQTHAIGDTGGAWTQVETISESNYEMAFIGFVTSGADAIVEVRARDSSNSSVLYPASSGIPLTGTELPTDDAGDSIEDAQIGNGLIPVPEDLGFIDIDYRTNFDPACNLYIWWILLDEHTHDVTVNIPDHVHSINKSLPDHAHVVDIPSHIHQFNWLHDHDLTIPDHQHAPDPGIIEFSEFPSSCDVRVNGSSVGVSHGDGTATFEATVDLEGELVEGEWNTIEVTSDTLGHIQAHLDVDVYRQILGDG